MLLTARPVEALSCTPLVDYLYVQCRNGHCDVVFRAMQTITVRCNRRTMLDSAPGPSRGLVMQQIQTRDAGAGRAWVVVIRYQYRRRYRLDDIGEAPFLALPADGVGSLAAERARWSALATRDTARW